MRIETYFLRYAFPCAFLKKHRGEINDALYYKLEDAAVNGNIIYRFILENVFKMAFDRIEQIAKQMNADKWDPTVIKHYFLSEHNKMIERKEGAYKNFPPVLCELCKISIGEIIDVKKDILTVKINDKTRKVLNHFVPHAGISDKVSVHYGYAVEIM